MKKWYAVEANGDTDWGTGSYSLDEAKRMAHGMIVSGEKDVMIAVIDESGSEPMCVGEIRDGFCGPYKISYVKDGRDISVIRHAETAEQAIDRLCDQYGWRWAVKLVDADTRGVNWCRGAVDTEGGINWNLSLYAETI